MANFGNWSFSVDRDATVAAYAGAERGGSEECDCNGCRNFMAARDQVYPSPFLAFLESLGVDSRKDGEVYHNAQIGPGCHDYGGWFHFVGSLERTGDFPPVRMAEGFTVWLQEADAPSLESLKGLSLVQVEFHSSRVPWVLDEPEAE